MPETALLTDPGPRERKSRAAAAGGAALRGRFPRSDRGQEFAASGDGGPLTPSAARTTWIPQRTGESCPWHEPETQPGEPACIRQVASGERRGLSALRDPRPSPDPDGVRSDAARAPVTAMCGRSRLPGMRARACSPARHRCHGRARGVAPSRRAIRSRISLSGRHPVAARDRSGRPDVPVRPDVGDGGRGSAARDSGHAQSTPRDWCPRGETACPLEEAARRLVENGARHSDQGRLQIAGQSARQRRSRRAGCRPRRTDRAPAGAEGRPARGPPRGGPRNASLTYLVFRTAKQRGSRCAPAAAHEAH